jgi:xylulokinase
MAPASDRYVLAIDMGSGSVKAAVVSSRAAVAASALSHITTHLLPGGGAEQDPAQWWSAAIEASRVAIANSGVPRDRIVAVACTTQWAVTVPVDQAGNPLCDAISWMDSRGGRYNRALSRGWPSVQGYGLVKLLRWLRVTGGVPVHSGADGLGHVLFLKYERPEIYARAHKLLEPMDFLNLKLTGRFAATGATMFTYWVADIRDPARVDYSPALLRLAGLQREKFPDLVPPASVIGTLTAEAAAQLGLEQSTRVVTGTCDLQAATIGAGCVDDGEGYFYIGTTSWMSCHIARKRTDPLHMLSAMPAAIPGRYVVTAEQGMAGRCLEFLRDILYPEPRADVYEDMNQLAAAVAPGSDGLIFTPWIGGVMAPADDAWTRSAFFNQSARTTRGHYVRAVMEGIAFNLRWLKGYVDKFAGRPFERLNFIGGGASSDLWCQIHADILGCPVRQVASPRSANGVGAAMAAFAALGDIQFDAIPSLVKIAAVYDPIAENRKIYDRRYGEFMEFYRRAKPIYRRMNPVADPD